MTKKGEKKPRAAAKPGAARRKVPWIALGIIALALVVRLVYLAQISASPSYGVLIIDSATYDGHARLLVSEGVFSQRFFWQGFFYPFFLAAVYSVTHGSVLAARLIQIALGSLLCAGVYRLGERLFDRRTGIAAGAIAALYGPLVYFEAEILDTGFSALWALVLVALFLKARNAKRLWPDLLLGVCGALSVTTRATFLPFLAVSFVWLLIGWRRSRAGGSAIAARAGLVLAGFLAIAVPVASLCHKATGDFNFLAEAGPINLFIGNNPDRDSTIMIRPGSEWRELTRMPMVAGSRSDSEDRDVFTRLFLDYVRTRPGDYMKGLAEKAAQFLSSRELPRNDDLYVARRYSGLLSALAWRAGTFGFPFGLLLPLALVGLVRYRKRIPAPVWIFLAAYPAAIVAVFVTGRYRIPLVPVLAIPAAAGALALVDFARARRWAAASVVIVALCVAAALMSAAGPFAVERYNYEAEMHRIVGFELMKQHRADAALAELSESLRLDAENGEAHKYIGLLLGQERRHAEAEEHLRAALAADPDSYLIRYYLGVTLLNLGERDEAREILRRARDGAAAAKEDKLMTEIDRVLSSLASIPRKDNAE